MTPDDYAIEFINATNVSIPTDSKSYRRLVATISAAVAAEHQRTIEQCKQEIDALTNVTEHGGYKPEYRDAFRIASGTIAALK